MHKLTKTCLPEGRQVLRLYFGRNCLLLQKVPGVEVFLEQTAEGLALTFGVEADGAPAPEFFDGNDVPNVEGREEGGHEIDFVRCVRIDTPCVAPGNDYLKTISIFSVRSFEGGLHLDAKQAAAVLNEKVVGMAVAVRFGYGDALAGGAVHECQFGEFTAEFRDLLQNISADFYQGLPHKKIDELCAENRKGAEESAP